MSKSVSKLIVEAVESNHMIAAGERIVVGVSGGADSMCLLHFLMSVKEKYSLKLTAAHINHNLRGDEAMRDQRAVEDFCRQHNIECRVLSADIKKLCAETGQGTEECGRKVRYDFFNSLCGENGKIATAHTMSDSVETVLFNLARGSGLKGLTGIPAVRDNIIRPLINITRQQVEQYCEENKIPYVTDSTNLTDEYSRNKIRHTVVPQLKSINPGAEYAVKRMSSIIEEQLGLTNSLAAELQNSAAVKNGYSCKSLCSAHFVVAKQAVINILNKAGCKSYEERHIELIMQALKDGGAVNLPKGYTAAAGQGIFRVYKQTEDSTPENFKIAVIGKENKSIVINEQKINLKFFTKQKYDKIKRVHKILVNNVIDYDIIHGETLFRTRQPSDIYKQYGRGVTKPVKKLLIDEKIPKEKRSSLLMLACGSEVIWLQGFGVSEKYKITDGTKTVLVVEAEGI